MPGDISTVLSILWKGVMLRMQPGPHGDFRGTLDTLALGAALFIF